jgi:solute:Na+ symporter, SSS family
MAIRTLKDVPVARNIGMSWMLISLIGAISLGIFGRAFAIRNGMDIQDPETIFIILANLLFHPLITGFLYAALLAAIMSTISSQLLVSSSSLTEDFYRLFLRKAASEKETVAIGRVCVVLVGLVAAVIASDEDSQVLGLVSNAWAGFGAAFGPLIILSLMWPRTNGAGAIAGMVVGAATVMIWITLGWNAEFMGGPGVYEIIPGFIASFIAILAVSTVTADAGEYQHITR